ncbi:MAG: TlpA family protein disulfide reductase [Phycisphaeraceae bacterium]|nr:MAG: TlpA family protein disulfide reductase [Phycisphaeraceae bacterium]
MKNHCRTLIAGAMAAAMVCAPATGAGPDPAEGPRVGWLWAIEPFDIHDPELHPRFGLPNTWGSDVGALRMSLGEREDEVILEFSFPTEPADRQGDNRILVTRPDIVLRRGEWRREFIDHREQHRGGAVSIDQWTLRIPGGLDAIATIGVAYSTYEGQRLAREHNRRQAQRRMEEAGAWVLPPFDSGQPYGDFEMPTLDHGIIRAQDFRGEVILIHNWASWCGPCERVYPLLRELEEQFADEGLVIIGVNFDESADVARRAAKEKGLSWPQIHAFSVSGPDLMDLWSTYSGLGTFPSSRFIDRDGNVSYERGLNTTRVERLLRRDAGRNPDMPQRN